MNDDSLGTDVDSHLACSVGYSIKVVADLEFLPEAIRGTKYFTPNGNGYEKTIIEYLKFVEMMKQKNKNTN